ncbi:MAG: hypothetical protein ACXVPQ_09190 [Bacteroidia bacterium]
MKIISDRVSIVETDEVFSLVILPTTDKKKLWLMFFWLMAWTVCGIIVLANYPRMSDPNAKLFIIVYLSFWAYFEYKIIRAYTWKKFGKEKLWIKQGKLFYQQEVSGKGKIAEYDLELVDELRFIELSNTSFADSFNSSFWVKGGERIEFQCQAKLIRFGLQLSDEEAGEVIRKMKRYLR